MTPLDRITPTRIALLKPSALGDIVHTLPVLSALRQRYPAAHISWVVNAAYEPLIAGHPDLTDTIPFDRGAMKKGLMHGVTSSLRFAARLRARKFDLVIDLQGLFRTGLMCLATGASRRVGLTDAREGSRYTYTDRIRVPSKTSAHAVDRLWSIAEAFGIEPQSRRFYLPIGPVEASWAHEQLAHLPRPWVAYAVGSRWETKRWPPAHYTALAKRAQKEYGGTAVFVGTGSDTAPSQEVGKQLPGPWLDLTGSTTLPQLTALLAACDVMVGNDTGPLHLAAAVATPCVAPYTCTKTALHGPYTSPSGGVATKVACAGSYLKKCGNMICMTELTPDRLWDTFTGVLDLVGKELPFRLILASGSQGRRELLTRAGYTFEVRPSNIPEPTEARPRRLPPLRGRTSLAQSRRRFHSGNGRPGDRSGYCGLARWESGRESGR